MAKKKRAKEREATPEEIAELEAALAGESATPVERELTPEEMEALEAAVAGEAQLDATPAASEPSPAEAYPEGVFYVRDSKGAFQPISYEDARRANASGVKVLSAGEVRALSRNVPPPSPQEAPVGPGETFLNRAANAIPLGHPLVDTSVAIQRTAADVLGRVLPRSVASRLPGAVAEPGARIPPAARAEMERLGIPVEDAPNPSLLDAYRQARNIRNLRTEVGAQENPVASPIGTATGTGLSAMLRLPSFASGQKLASQVLSGAKTGAAYGALTGLTEGDADLTRGEVGKALQNALVGGTAGGVMGAAVPAALSGGRSLWRGIVKPTQAAQYLRSKGVPLTVGQMNPKSKLAQLEEVATSYGGIGPEIEAQRAAGSAGWQNVVLDEARPPGMPRLNTELPISERLADAYAGFDDAYAPSRGVQVTPKTSSGVPLAPPVEPPPAPRPRKVPRGEKAPVILDEFGRPMARPEPAPIPEPPPSPPSVFDTVVQDPSVLATADERGVVKRFLDNELTLLSRQADGGTVSSDAILKMRSNVRDALADKMKAAQFDQAKLLQNAERQLTDVLESSLPPESMAALRAADAKYAQYKRVEDAVARSGDQPDGFTPSQLSAAVRASMEKGAGARGGGGELRSLAAAGRKVFDARVPKTGARLLATFPPLRWPMAVMSYSANLPGPQRFLLGETAPQRAGQSVEAALANFIRRNPSEAVAREMLPALSAEEQRRLLEQQAEAEALRVQ